jgi:OPA family glycerol-3-phosphate transporter-like MFS transporter
MTLTYVRQLDEYPTGSRRLRILTATVFAILIGSYEAQIAPVVPLLLKDLHITLTTYGAVSAVAALTGAIASFAGGRLTDQLGRVRLLIPLMLVTSLCCFGMTLVHSVRGLLIARIVLAFVDGFAMASTTPLIRDFSPRLGRAQGYAFWAWGPVGANLLAAAIAGWTLPAFHESWRSQFVIMGVLSIVFSLLIAANIADLSPELRAQIQQTEHQARRVVDAARPIRVRTLFTRRNVWAHVVGISLWLVLYMTLSLYGQTMLVQTFHLTAAKASSIMTGFWLLNLITLAVSGRLSDRLQLRKPFLLGGTVLVLIMAGYFALLMGRDSVSTGQLTITGALLGGALGTTYAVWMASYSEDTEDVDARLQGTAWGVFGFLTKVTALVTLLIVPGIVEAAGWQSWLWVAVVCLVFFIPATFLFNGPWRRPAGSIAPRGPAAEQLGVGTE